MGKSHNINTYSDEYAENVVSYDYKIKGCLLYTSDAADE